MARPAMTAVVSRARNNCIMSLACVKRMRLGTDRMSIDMRNDCASSPRLSPVQTSLEQCKVAIIASSRHTHLIKCSADLAECFFLANCKKANAASASDQMHKYQRYSEHNAISNQASKLSATAQVGSHVALATVGSLHMHRSVCSVVL